MPEVQEVFRMATQKVGPEPGALERQFQGQRRRVVRQRTSAIVLAAALTVAAVALAVQASSDTSGGDRVPAVEGTTGALLTIPAYGYGFDSDGTHVLARVEASGTIYDAETGELIQTVTGRGEGVVAFSENGERFATVRGCGACDQEEPHDALRTWVYDVATGEQLSVFRRACCFAALSSDGRLLAIPQKIPYTSVTDVETGERVLRVDTFGGMSFSPDGEQLLITPDPGAAEARVIGYVFDVSGDGDPALTLRANGSGNVVDVYAAWDAWSEDGSMIAIPTSTGKVVVWDAETGEKLLAIDAGGDLTFADFGPDDLLVAASTSGAALVYDLSSGSAELVTTIQAYNKRVEQAHFDPSGDRIMTAAINRPAKIWNIEF